MFANPTFNVGISQRVVATLVACAVLLASIGLYTQTAQAASLHHISDTLSDSAPAIASDHTIVFTTPTGVANGQTVVIDFAQGPFVVGSVDFSDIDVATTSDYTIAANCAGAERIGAAFAGTTLTLTFCAGDGGSIPASGTTTIQIGTNATFGVAGNAQLTNPALGSYEIVVTAGASDSGRTRVAIVNSVLVEAIVDTTFTFTITGLATSTSINGVTTTGSTSPTSIDYARLVADTPEVLGQRLNVTTNANNGFVVTVEQDGDLESGNGARIDSFQNGSYLNTPGVWTAPSDNIANEATWGHWGLTSTDDLNTDEFGSALFVAASTTPRQVFTHNGPADGTTTNMGSTSVAYKIEITPLQEAADDYNATLTYIATPTF